MDQKQLRWIAEMIDSEIKDKQYVVAVGLLRHAYRQTFGEELPIDRARAMVDNWKATKKLILKRKK